MLFLKESFTSISLKPFLRVLYYFYHLRKKMKLSIPSTPSPCSLSLSLQDNLQWQNTWRVHIIQWCEEKLSHRQRVNYCVGNRISEAKSQDTGTEQIRDKRCSLSHSPWNTYDWSHDELIGSAEQWLDLHTFDLVMASLIMLDNIKELCQNFLSRCCVVCR